MDTDARAASNSKLNGLDVKRRPAPKQRVRSNTSHIRARKHFAGGGSRITPQW